MDSGTAFSTAHIGLTAGLVGVASLAIVAVWARPVRLGVVVGVAVTTAAATFGWRMAANVGPLNQDGVPWVSANDVLAPMLTYVLLGMYATFLTPDDPVKFEKLRCVVAAVALVVNVVAI